MSNLFVSQRNITIGGPTGHRITFVKGEPTHVPPAMHESVLNRGCVPCDEKGKPVEGGASLSDPDQPHPAAPPPLTAEQRAEKIKVAFDEIVARNDPRDFSGSTPAHQAVAQIVGFRTDAKEVRQVWSKVRIKYLNKEAAEQ